MTRQSSFIPNSYQTPNAYVDNYLHLLTGEEWKALSYAIRRILGFQKRRDRISLSQFSNGIVGEDGKRLDFGCGLNVDTLRRVLSNLVGFGFLTKLAENDPKTNEGVEYELQLDDSKIDMTALITRGKEKKSSNRKRIRKAISALSVKRHQYPLLSDDTPPPIVAQHHRPIVAQHHRPIVPPQHNNQGNTGKERIPPQPTLEAIEQMTIQEALALPEIRLYKKITNRTPGDSQWTIIVEFVREHNPSEESLRSCWKAWRRQDYRPGGLGWLDWVVSGIPDFSFKKNGNKTKNSPVRKNGLTEEQLAASRKEAERIFSGG